MQTVFDQQLDALTTTIADRCALAGCVAQGARQALLQPDLALAGDVIGEYTKIAGTAASAEWDALSCWLGMPRWSVTGAPSWPS